MTAAGAGPSSPLRHDVAPGGLDIFEHQPSNHALSPISSRVLKLHWRIGV